jgi:hypothetical protein
MSVSIGVAVLVMATVVPVSTASAPTAPCTDTDVTCALIMGLTSLPTPDDAYIDAVKNQFIAPTHPGQQIEYVSVTTPEEGWPLTGLIRLGCAAVGAPSLCGPGGPAWPDEPWWKLSGLFDLTYDQSRQVGLADLERAMANHGNDNLVIYGYSQGAEVANLEKQRLAQQYPAGTQAPDIDFVLGGDGNLPNGGLEARFPGLYIPILNWTFAGPEPTNTQFDTTVITRQYDGVADFPLYPLNAIADVNALLGFFYVHLNGFDVSLPPDPTKSPAYQGKHGDTSYYFFETKDLPLFGPLRTLGVPEPVIDVVEPFFRVLVELGYDRSIPPWEPTPARLIPQLDPAKVMTDLVAAIGEGINNAFTLFGSPLPSRSPVPVTLAATGTQQMSTEIAPLTTKVTETANADVSRQVTPIETVTETGQVTSAKKVTETAKADEASTGPTEASAPEPSADASTSEPVKPTVRRVTPRPVVRGSLGVGEQLRDLPHRGNGGHPTTRTAAAGDGAATAGPSSVASSPAASSAAGDDSSGGDAGES